METTVNEVNNSHKLMKRLSNLQVTGKLCDVKFVCVDGFVQAHSAVLACSCHAFGSLITMSNIVIPLDQYLVKTVQQLLSYLYTGDISCNAIDELRSFMLLVNQLIQINANQPEISNDPRDLLATAKTFVELKLRQGMTEANTPETERFGSTVQADANTSDVLRDSYDHQTSEIIQQGPCIPATNSQMKGKVNESIGLQRTEITDVARQVRASSSEETLETNEPPQDDFSNKGQHIQGNKERKIVTRSISKPLKNVQEKAFKVKVGKLRQKSKPGTKIRRKKRKVSQLHKSATEDEEDIGDSVLSPGERPDWTLHKGGDWHPDKYKKIFKRKKLDRAYPFLCGMCGHRAHDMRHHLNHLHCKHKIPYKKEDIGKWVEVCPYEGCNYAAALNLKSHIYHVHETKTGAFTCDTCKKVFKRECSLRTHMRRVHVKPCDFKACPECGKMVSSHYLEKHIATVHNPDHYHLCSHCHFKTKSLSSARFHMITKHNDYSLGKVTIHECKYCDYKGTHIDNVQRHMTVHEIKMGLQSKNVLCDICGKAFAHQRLMESHRLWHTSKDRHKCQYCNFSAPFIRHVKLHTQRQHTQKELRPWRCTHCAYASNDRGNLKKHLLNTHKLPEPEVVEIMKSSLTSAQSQPNTYPHHSFRSMSSN